MADQPGSSRETERQRAREVTTTKEARRHRWLIAAVILLPASIIGASIYWTFGSSDAPPVPVAALDLPGCEGPTEHEDQGAQHIEVGAEHEPYNSNPPSSGPHWGQPAPFGVHEERQPDEAIVHSLEHGGVAIHYQPDNINDLDLSDMKDVVGFRLETGAGSGVLLNPNPDSPGLVAYAAWQVTLVCDSYERSTMLAFIDTYCGQGPEDLPLGCAD